MLKNQGKVKTIYRIKFETIFCSLMFGFLIFGLPAITVLYAQETETHNTWEAYIERDIDANGTDRLLFLNILTGEITSAEVNGERYTPIADEILYFDRATRAVMTVQADGTMSPHPFIQLGTARRVDWVLSSDRRLIAWTITTGDANSLSTMTYLSEPDGRNQRLLLEDGPRSDGARVFPVAFSYDNTSLVLDAQPDTIGDLVPYRQYAAMFRLSLLDDGNISPMPGEPSCFCAAALRAGQFIRLVVSSSGSGFDLRIYDILSGEARTINSLGFDGYTQGGDIFISPDGRLAVYALSQVQLGVADAPVRTVILLLDLESMTQRQLGQVISSYLNPVRWTDDDSAVLFTIPNRNGTWKMNIATGELVQVAQASFIGVLEN